MVGWSACSIEFLDKQGHILNKTSSSRAVPYTHIRYSVHPFSLLLRWIQLLIPPFLGRVQNPRKLFPEKPEKRENGFSLPKNQSFSDTQLPQFNFPTQFHSPDSESKTPNSSEALENFPIDPQTLSFLIDSSSMISNPSLIYYACIARNEIILGEIAKEPGIGALAQKCIEKTPPHHSLYTHTVRKRTYLFTIADPFVFFGVFDQYLDQSEALKFLDRLRCDFDKIRIKNGGDVQFESHCFQAEFDSIVREIMALNSELEMPVSPPASRNLSVDLSAEDSSSGKGKRMVLAPLLGLKKKKRLSGEVCRDAAVGALEKNVDVVCVDGREFTMPLAQKSLVSCERQKAKQVWRKHVWVVLVLDLFVCAVLFGVWLWVCRGLKCIDS